MKSPFTSPGSPGSLGSRLAAKPAVIVFACCVALGSGVVAWRAMLQADAARANARRAGMAGGAALERQLSQVATAAEILGALAKPTGGTLANFQKVAVELLASRPALATLELQPAGVVREIAPRTGNERALGFNVLNDPAHRPGAYAAVQRRTLTLAGPVPLYGGEPGIVARVPMFQTGRDGREFCSGFVAASMRLHDALAAARLEGLAKEGFDYSLYAPVAGGSQPVVIAASGGPSFEKAVQIPVRIQNLEFRLALQRTGGWINKIQTGLEALVALVVSGLAALIFNLLESRRAVEEGLAEANQRHSRESQERTQAQEESRIAKEQAATAREELSQARATCQQAQAATAELQARFDTAMREAGEEHQTLLSKVKEAESQTVALQSRLETATHAAEAAAQAAQAELEQTRAALRQARQTNRELQARLEEADRAEKEATASAQEIHEQDQAMIATLQSRLNTAERANQDMAAAHKARLAELEQTIHELREKLQAKALVTMPEAIAPAPTLDSQAEWSEMPSKLVNLDIEETTVAETSEVQPATADEILPREELPIESEPLVEASSDNVPMGFPEVEVPPNPEATLTEPNTSDVPPASDTAAVTSETKAIEPGNVVPALEQVVEATPEPAPAGKRGTEKPVRRGKRAQDDQMDLFGAPSPRDQAAAKMPPEDLFEIPPDRPVEPAEIIAAKPDDAESPIEPVEVEAPHITTEMAPPVQPPVKPREERPARPRVTHTAPVDMAELRKAVHLIVPLLAGEDPGAKDCWKDNRAIYRSAFAPETCGEFEQALKTGQFSSALELLKKAAKKHGISV